MEKEEQSAVWELQKKMLSKLLFYTDIKYMSLIPSFKKAAQIW